MIYNGPHDPKTPKHSPKHVFRNVWFMFRYTFKYCPGYIWVTLIEACGRALDHIMTGVVFVRYLFNAIEEGVDFRGVLIATLLISAYRAAFEMFNKWMLNVYRPKANLKLHEGMQTELYRKARELDQSCYDDPDFYNDFIWAIRESDARTVRMMVDLSIFLNRIISTVAILGILATMDWIVALAVTVSTVLSFLVKIKLNKVRYEKSLEMNPITRQKDYIGRVFYLTDHAKELRQGEIAGLMKEDYGKATDRQIACIRKFAPKLVGLSFLSGFLTNFLFDAGVTGYLIVRYALDATLTLGDFSASINAVWKLYWQMNEITEYLTRFNEHSIFVDKFRRFLEYEPKIKGGEKQPEPFSTLTLANVSFAYPFSKEKTVLKNLSLTVRRGEKIAFVGYNGAGKTTLTKLLMRLYDTTEGQILYNGTDIRDYDLGAYRGHIGAVFQDYKIFAATIAENVLGGEYDEGERDNVIGALRSASFGEKLAALPAGIDTPLTREFEKNGVNLSGGETQKVAIARVFARPFDLIIMDEPSSALDPIAEYELNHSILRDAADKTVIFISHRLSTTRMADRIYMFDNGEIVESGNHDELMAMGGKYARMYTVQAEKYREKAAFGEI